MADHTPLASVASPIGRRRHYRFTRETLPLVDPCLRSERQSLSPPNSWFRDHITVESEKTRLEESARTLIVCVCMCVCMCVCVLIHRYWRVVNGLDDTCVFLKAIIKMPL